MVKNEFDFPITLLTPSEEQQSVLHLFCESESKEDAPAGCRSHSLQRERIFGERD